MDNYLNNNITMTQEIDGKTYTTADLEEIRRQQLDILGKDAGNADAICDLVCADALLCEEYVMDFGPAWKNAALCREIAKYMPAIIECGDNFVMAANVCYRARRALYDHPRLSLKLMELERDAIIGLSDEQTENLEMDLDSLNAEITRYSLNIKAADQKRFNDIEDDGHLRKDPIEWTAEYEEAIAQAEEKAQAELADEPRGMGFCFSYWPTLQHILFQDYGIRWRSPAEMNPGVIFD